MFVIIIVLDIEASVTEGGPCSSFLLPSSLLVRLPFLPSLLIPESIIDKTT